MSILFCTPCYGGMVTQPHFNSCLRLKEALTEFGLEHDWLTGSNESLVTRARNEMTATYLTTHYTHMMWIDADISFDPEHVAALWNMNVPVAVGVYPMKKRDEEWYAAWMDGELVKDLDQFSEPVEVDFAGTGFMMISRETITTLAEDAAKYEGPNGIVNEIYKTQVFNDYYESEDYYFCRKWRETGGKIMMDPSIRLLHHGSYAYGSR